MKNVASFLIFAVISLVSPNALTEVDGLSPELERALLERVEQRWAHMAEREFDKVWEFSTSTYREIFSKRMFVKNFSYGVEWRLTRAEVRAYDADAAVASVAARVMTEPTKHTTEASKALGAIPQTFNEQWMLIDGVWWYSALQ